MTLYGKEIGIPSFEHIKKYVADSCLYSNAEDIYNYWENKKWLTAKKKQVKSVEIACHVYNGIVIHREIKRKMKKSKITGETKEERKQCWDRIKTKYKESIKLKRKEKLIIYENEKQKQYTDYRLQLKDEKWKAFRWFVMKVRGSKCELCGKEKSIQVHHVRYKSNCKAWEYTCNDVIVVCVECHKKIHNIS